MGALTTGFNYEAVRASAGKGVASCHCNRSGTGPGGCDSGVSDGKGERNMTPEEAGLTRKDHSVLTRVSPCKYSVCV